MGIDMTEAITNCLHLGGLRVSPEMEFRCPACEERLDLDGVGRWVRAAERERDEAYSMVEGDEFGRIAFDETQREVYRRRGILYEVQNVSQVVTAKPEMVLVSFEEDGSSGVYECKIFYKEPRPESGVETLSVEADIEAIWELRSDPSPVIRSVADKIWEFHEERRVANREDVALFRRTFYAKEF
jgi:hypothetical protein